MVVIYMRLHTSLDGFIPFEESIIIDRFLVISTPISGRTVMFVCICVVIIPILPV